MGWNFARDGAEIFSVRKLGIAGKIQKRTSTAVMPPMTLISAVVNNSLVSG